MGTPQDGFGKNKLTEIEKLKTGFQAQKEQIVDLQSFEIDNISDNKVDSVTSKLWDILNNLQVGVGETKIVAGSKALHHLLPNLMPPLMVSIHSSFSITTEKRH